MYLTSNFVSQYHPSHRLTIWENVTLRYGLLNRIIRMLIFFCFCVAMSVSNVSFFYLIYLQSSIDICKKCCPIYQYVICLNHAKPLQHDLLSAI